MSRIIDSFLFFQELDLLEIRLEYLDPYVDLFVISEAGQTFSGKQKEFIFEKNTARYKKYLHKIHYQKIEDFHESYEAVSEFTLGAHDPKYHLIHKIMSGHSHYPKSELNWVLDTYHRECLHLALGEVAKSKDIVLISDLDEIPSESVFTSENIDLIRSQPRVFQQHEFRYFLNYYKDSEWLGTIGAQYEDINNVSLNELRIDSKIKRQIVAKQAIQNAGYHFTTCGGLDAIKQKIQGWGHQEFNNPTVLKNLESNIKKGKDIFYRESGTNLVSINISDDRFFSNRFSVIMQKYPHLVSGAVIELDMKNNIGDLLALLHLNFGRLKSKVRRMLKPKGK